MNKAQRITPQSEDSSRVKITSTMVDRFRARTSTAPAPSYLPYEPPSGVLPKGVTGHGIAMDAGFSNNFDWFAGQNINGLFQEGYAFPGFQVLAQWSQIVEYRKPCEVYAREMTRKWIKVIATSDTDKTDRIAQIEDELLRLNAQAVFCKAIEHDAIFGRAHIFLDMGEQEGAELKTPLVESPQKVAKKGLKRLQVVEPFWFYPNQYNANNPLAPNFYRPTSWFCMGQEVHSSRLCNIVTRELPDIIKPSYAFAGLSLQQVMKPYIDNWLRTRQNVSDLINAFNVWTLKTDMSSTTMDNGGNDFYQRLELFNLARDNHGINAIDLATEDFASISANLSSLDKLQAQAQEHMSAACGLPLIYLTGITPTGLNASSQDEIEVFQDTLSANQEMFSPHVTKIMNLVMLSLFGEIDKDIGFNWEPLKVVTEKERAEIRKMEAELNTAYIDAAVLAPDEVRQQIAGEEDSPFAGLDLDRVIEPPQDPSQDPEMQDFNESIGGSSGNED